MKERKGKALCSCGKLTVQDPFWKPIYEWDNYSEIESPIFKKNILFWAVFYFPGLVIFQRLLTKTNTGKRFKLHFISFCSFMSEYTYSKIFIYGQKAIHPVIFFASQNIPLEIIHLTKHPLEFVASLKHRYLKKQKPINIKYFAKVWLRYNKRILEISEKTGSIGYIHVDYHDFCSNTESVLKKICLFLNVPFEKKMLDPHPDAQHIIGADSVTRFFSGIKKNLSKIEILQKDEIEKTLAITGQLAKKLKYDLSLP